jgi:hypothetical protein
MPQNTPNRGYTYPEYTDLADFPTQDQLLATQIDTDLFNNLQTPADEAVEEPSVRTFQSGSQAVGSGVNVTLTYDLVETYDNDGMYTGGVSNTNIIVQTPGTYLVTGSVNISSVGASPGSCALIVMSTGPVTNPVGVSRPLDNDKVTSLSCTTLHRVTTVPETLTLVARQNTGIGLTATIAQFTVTRIST